MAAVLSGQSPPLQPDPSKTDAFVRIQQHASNSHKLTLLCSRSSFSPGYHYDLNYHYQLSAKSLQHASSFFPSTITISSPLSYILHSSLALHNPLEAPGGLGQAVCRNHCCIHTKHDPHCIDYRSLSVHNYLLLFIVIPSI
jgi:hypothetical protein